MTLPLPRLRRVLGRWAARLSPRLSPDMRRILFTEGYLSEEECRLLRDLAAEAAGGCIVEIGSYRGRSTTALALGTRGGAGLPVYAVEPHAVFQGEHARYGPQDRVAFFRNVLRAGCADIVRLLSTRSEIVTPGWTEPVALLWIDGDHRYEGVKRDMDGWGPHVVSGGVVAFHDTNREGPAAVVREALATGEYDEVRTLGRTSVLRKR